MGIKIANQSLKAGMLVDSTGAKKTIKKIGICTTGNMVVQVWPDDPIIGLNPTILMPLNNDLLDYSGNGNNPINSTGTALYTVGIDGRKALACASQFAVALNAAAKVVGPFTISVLINPQVVAQETTRNGLLGGVISGNNSMGLGYTVAARVNGDLSQGFQFQQYPKNQVSPNVDASYCISDGQWEQTLNIWMHLLLEFDSTPEGRGMYLNGYRHGTYSNTAQKGNVNYSDRDRGWDGNIWLGRCFQTTRPPEDWWCGYIQDFVLWNRKLTDAEKKIVFNRYIGNMIGSLGVGFLPINSLKHSGVFICSGGTNSPGMITNRFDCTDNRVKPNGTKATTIEVDLDTLSGDWIYFYVNRSLDSSIRGGGATGYKFTINGVEYIHTFSNLGRLNFNVDGSGTILGIPKIVMSNLGNYTIKALLPGFDSEQTITVTVTQTVKSYNFRFRFTYIGQTSYIQDTLYNWRLQALLAQHISGVSTNLIGSPTEMLDLLDKELVFENVEDPKSLVSILYDKGVNTQSILGGCVTVHRIWTNGYPVLFIINPQRLGGNFLSGVGASIERLWDQLTETDGKTIILYVGLLNVYYDENQFSVIKNSSIEQGFNQIS